MRHRAAAGRDDVTPGGYADGEDLAIDRRDGRP